VNGYLVLEAREKMKPVAKNRESYSLWIESLKAKRESCEKERKATLRQVQTALKTLAKDYSWDELYIFGSVLKAGRFSGKSDVDIAVKGLNKFKHYSFVGEISALLGREVDVIRLEDCHFSDSIVSRGMKYSEDLQEFKDSVASIE
jgi:predicted nucleotidyltransferase